MRIYKFVPETVSTNSDVKKEIYSAESPCYTVLRAGRQTGGRGRLGRSFFSPEGGLYFSISLPVDRDFENIPVITLLCGLAVSTAIDKLCEVKTQIKWPNDIYLNGKKLGGILTELVSGKYLTAVIGTGINLAAAPEDIPEELKSRMTSLYIEGGKSVDPDLLMREITENTDALIKENNLSVCLEKIRERSFLTGKAVSFRKDEVTVNGIFTDIAPTGEAIVRTETGETVAVMSGEIAAVF